MMDQCLALKPKLGSTVISPSETRFLRETWFLVRLAAHFLHALLAGDGLAWALTGPGISTRPLAAHRQAAAVPQPAVAADVAQPLDILLHLPAERAFHRVFP